MAAPSITIVNEFDTTIASWDCGTVQANTDSGILTMTIWNNRGGGTATSDLKDVSITALDVDGGSTTDVVAGKWTQVNVPAVDGNSTTWTAVGGSTTKMLRADGLASSDGSVIRGTVNDGSLASSKPNYVTCRLKVHVPLNAQPGTKDWKMRLNGYYV